jgi:hypothetical protein
VTSLAELLVAAAVTTVVMGGVLAALGPAHAVLLTQADAQDVTQRLRVASEALTRELLAATLVRPHAGTGGMAIRQGPSERVYFVDGAASQLRRVDAGGTDLPVLDGVAAMSVEFIGDAGPVPPSRLADGPWLPDAAAPDRFDADLLPLRRIRVEVTLSGGRAGERTLVLDVAPRNAAGAP